MGMHQAKRNFNPNEYFFILFINIISKLLNASEFLWMLDAFDNSSSVFDMAKIIFDSRVENIG